MKIWLALKNVNEIIGTKQVHSKAYNEYLKLVKEIEEHNDCLGELSWGHESIPTFTGEEYERVNVTIQVPRVITISYESLDEKYLNDIWNISSPYKTDRIWIESFEIDDLDKSLKNHIVLQFGGKNES
jgi:hypothetical protein